MIISASRRTDIPACHADWFFNRLQAGFADVRNPMNPRQVSRVRLSPDCVDGILFWTKNPLPMLARLDALRDYAYGFQFTLTPYGPDLEPGLPGKPDVLVPAFRRLAALTGPGRVVWRYDPVLVSERYPADFHREWFARLAAWLEGSTQACVMSFIDFYPAALHRLKEAGLVEFPPESRLELARDLADIARRHGMTLSACAEKIDLRPAGIDPASCVDVRMFERQLGHPLRKTKGQPLREGCGCLPSIDIGQYDTCRIGCRYCYASRSEAAAARLCRAHDPQSSLICGHLGPDDVVRERRMVSLRL